MKLSIFVLKNIENFIRNIRMGLKNNIEKFDAIGDNHIGTSAETPMRLMPLN